MRVAACQVPDVRNDIPTALGIVRDHAMHAERREADLVLFPECFLQGYFTDKDSVTRLAITMASPEFSAILEFLSDLQITIVLGFIERSDARCAGSVYYNTAVAVRGGKTICRYRKCCLLDGERDSFEPGLEYPTFEVSGQITGINICYDLNFDAAVQPLVTKGARVLVCPCNNMMPYAKAEALKRVHNDIRAHGLLS